MFCWNDVLVVAVLHAFLLSGRLAWVVRRYGVAAELVLIVGVLRVVETPQDVCHLNGFANGRSDRRFCLAF